MKRIPDRRLDPPDEPDEIGKCIGCGDLILANEPYAMNDNGDIIHKHVLCLAQYAAELFEINRKEIEK